MKKAGVALRYIELGIAKPPGVLCQRRFGQVVVIAVADHGRERLGIWIHSPTLWVVAKRPNGGNGPISVVPCTIVAGRITTHGRIGIGISTHLVQTTKDVAYE